ncbi:tetratricopeptide repeat protein, partial [bacterium]|nr:tetratricopeptide repeat protein [bacterium]
EQTMLSAADIEPDSPKVAQNLALVYLKQKDFDRALAAFQRAVALKAIIHVQYIGAGFAVGSLMLALFSLFGIPTIIFYGFLTGIGQSAFMAFPQFLGAIIGRAYFQKRFGEVKWRAYAPILMAGYGCGVGLIGMTTVALKLIASAVKQTLF